MKKSTNNNDDFFISNNICIQEFNYSECDTLIKPKSIVCFTKYANLNEFKPLFHSGKLYLENGCTVLGSIDISINKTRETLMWSPVTIPYSQLIPRELGGKMKFFPKKFKFHKKVSKSCK
jgi:hypothetical protein